jgi:tRNA threonylcarbamoyl adenosine modification protein YeaZ
MDATALPSDVLAETLSTQIHETGIEPSAIKAIVVGIGPGSFTGIRVGLATAKGLGLGARIPLYGISSLSALALSAGEGYCAVVLDARQEEFYTALYHVDRDCHLEPLLEDGTRSLADFKRALGDAMEDRGACSVRVVGDAADALFGEDIAGCVLEVNAGLEPTIAFSVLALQERLRAGDADHLQGLSPRYMRLTAAERNLKNS